MNFANVREAAGAIIKHRCSAGGTATGAERRARSALGGSHGNETPQPGEAGHQGILGSRAVSSASRSGVLYNHAREKDCPTHTHSHTHTHTHTHWGARVAAEQGSKPIFCVAGGGQRTQLISMKILGVIRNLSSTERERERASEAESDNLSR